MQICGTCQTRISKIGKAAWVHVEARAFPYDHDASPAPAESAAAGEPTPERFLERFKECTC